MQSDSVLMCLGPPQSSSLYIYMREVVFRLGFACFLLILPRTVARGVKLTSTTVNTYTRLSKHHMMTRCCTPVLPLHASFSPLRVVSRIISTSSPILDLYKFAWRNGVNLSYIQILENPISCHSSLYRYSWLLFPLKILLLYLDSINTLSNSLVFNLSW